MKIKNKNKSTQIGNRNISIQMYNDSMVDKVVNLMKKGEFEKTIYEIESLKKSISPFHKLYPYYRVEVISSEDGNTRLKSVPNSKEAIEKYPPKFIGKLTISDKYNKFKTMDELLEHSYKNQKDIEVNIIELTKMLGNEIDPYQDLNIEDIKSGSAKIKHKKFPPPKAMKLYFKDKSFSIDYLEIGLFKIENEKLFFNNSKQDSRLFFELIFDQNNEKNSSINIEVKEDYKYNVKANLEFLQFMKNANSNKKVILKLLTEDKNIFQGIIHDIKFCEEKYAEEEHKYLESLLLIEDKLGVKFDLSNNVTQETLENIKIVKSALQCKQIDGVYSELNVKMRIEKNSIEMIKKFKENGSEFKCITQDVDFKILNINITVKEVVRIFKNAKIKNIDKLIKKVEICDIGDEINIELIPKNDYGKYVEKYKIF